ncbi:MAG: magnesium transporter [Ruminococcaceae bacterium]|nr:magnesium transporter [Oscillospiraceae bacterium]
MRENTFVLTDTISALLEARKFTSLRDILVTMNSADIAILFEEMPESKLPLLFRLLPKELAADTFVEMEADVQEMLIKGFSDAELKEVVDELYVDDAVDLIEEMPANVVQRILHQADPEMRKMINDILKYPKDSAGSIMTTEYVNLRPLMTVAEAIKHIRRTGVDKETIYTCYVTSNRMLVGQISLKTLLLAEEDDVIQNIMEQNPIYVTTTDDQEQVARTLSKYDFIALPVVDQEVRLVGIVTVDDAIDVIEEEATEDIEKMNAIMLTEKEYLQTSSFALWKARIPWLLILMISATLTQHIIASYEEALSAVVVLTAFIPMLMGTGGNAGGQASATIIRGLSLNEIEPRDILKVLWKEVRVGFMCAITLGVATLLKIVFLESIELHVAVVVALALSCTVVLAKVIGCMLPLAAKRIGLDPAVMSSPFITTIVDALSLVIYFQFASMILGI